MYVKKQQILFLLSSLNVLFVSGGGPHYCTSGHDPCQNGATCIAISNGHFYMCTCMPGFTGTDCQSFDCSSSIYCKNGGTCSTFNGGSRYTCKCGNGWMGSNCEQIDCSSSLYCINGGTCSTLNGGTKYTCNCADGWMGSNCEQIDVCTPYKKADIVFVLDTSLSEGDDGFEKQKQYVKRFISKYQYQIGPPNYRYQFSLITYSLHATVHFYFNTFNNETDLQNAMDLLKVNCSGPSLAGNALKIVRGDVFQTSNGARKDPDVERYIMLLSDGLLSDAPDTILEANVLKVNGFKIYTIGSGKSILHENLLEISSFNDYVFHMATEDGIQTLLKHTMFGCKKCSSKVSDVAILMDVSASIKHQELDIQIRAVIHLLGITKVGPKATQFSYSTFTETVHNVYDFTTYKSRADQIADISKKTRQTISTTANLANALNELKQNGFSAGRGSRLDARKIIVVVTTGSTNDMKQVLTETNKLRNSGKIIVTVGAGLNANYTNLLEISSDPALTFILGDDVHINVKVLDSLKTLLEYDECSHV
ncbi:collagen alpha-6(VI) chain-like isoform X1 [Ruditapes philippinarum]|uniref:collagen alpha-6(VI) chain-like isoform X1 n=2 Tax=Ruditapes philippinarum TaxID=129788 RepID=UPI00295B5D1A|nr:collagen alpha-6(VI) chain-like isoform X1 [Ruditapes philippinarum]